MQGLDSYNQNGYLLISDLYSDEEKSALLREVTALTNWPETPGKWMRYYEPHRITQEKILCRIENFIPYSDLIRNTLTQGKMIECLNTLYGSATVLYKDKINFKLPGANGFVAHQDAPAFSAQGPLQKSHITVLIALDDMTIENGCLEVATNTREIWEQKKMLPHSVKGEILPEFQAEFIWKPIVMRPGDVLFFGSYIPHRSGPNLTSKARRALYITYNALSDGDKHDQYYIDKRKAFPPECERVPGVDYSEGAKIYNVANPIYV